MKQEDFNEQFRRRTKQLALDIIRKLSEIRYSDALGVIRKQEFRACTSVTSNFRAVYRSRSEQEKFSKLCTVVEEADETGFWLEMVVDAGFLPFEALEKQMNEADEILKVMASYKKHLEPKT